MASFREMSKSEKLMFWDVTLTFNTGPTTFLEAALYSINLYFKCHLHFPGAILCPLFPIQSVWDSWCLCLSSAFVFKDPAGLRNSKYGGLTLYRSLLFVLSSQCDWVRSTFVFTEWWGELLSLVFLTCSLLRHIVISSLPLSHSIFLVLTTLQCQ